MATPPNLHCICDDCWKKSNPGQNGILPNRVHVVQLRECCACGEKTASGIFIDDHHLLYRCKGIHPMTDQELRATMASFFRQAVSVAERTCILKHSLAADRARHTVAAALTDVLAKYCEEHGISSDPREEPVHPCPVCGGKGTLDVVVEGNLERDYSCGVCSSLGKVPASTLRRYGTGTFTMPSDPPPDPEAA